MGYPNFKNKHLEKPVFDPADFLKKYQKKEFKAPETVILCFQKFLTEFAASGLKAVRCEDSVVPLLRLSKDLALCHSSIGAPAAVANMEELTALGTKRFVCLGLAGGLSEKTAHSRVVLCDKALRDEGTSHHYLKPGRFAFADGGFTAELEGMLRTGGFGFLKGASWTTDAPYRETVGELRKYRDEGILTVEMEASAVFAVAEYRKVKAAGVFVVSDILSEKGWEPGFHFKGVRETLKKLLSVLAEKIG